MSSGGYWGVTDPNLRPELVPGPSPAMTGNPLIGALITAATQLGINPIQFASGIVANPEGAAEVLDGSGVPSPDAAVAAEPPLGEALMGSEPIDYQDDPTVTPPQPGLSSPPVPAPSPPQSSLSILPGQDPGVAAPGNAPPQGAPDLAKILSGVQPPEAPQVPQLGTPGVPSPRSIQGPTLDELVRGALGVAAPASNAITLANTVGRR